MNTKLRKTITPLLAAVALLVTACGGGSGAQPTGPAAPAPPAPPPTTAAAPASSTELVEPVRDLTPWEQVTAGIGADGTVSKEVALQAFAVTFGALPGVDAPRGKSGQHSGTAALWWLSQYDDELTPAQRQAAAKALGDTTETAAVTDGPDVQLMSARSGGRQSLFGETEYPCAKNTTLVDEDGPGAEAYRSTVDRELVRVEGILGEKLGIPVYLTVGDNPNPDSETFGYAGPQSTDCTSTPATSCRIHLYANRIATGPPGEDRRTAAHELVHCFQTHWMATLTAMTQPTWLVEGFPEFLRDQTHPDGEKTSFKNYTLNPNDPLFTRAYNAEGFYFHLMRSGGEPYDRYKVAFLKRDNLDAFAYLTDGVGVAFDDTWASALALDPVRGDAWYMPDAPDDAKPFYGKGTVRDDGRVLRVDAGPAATHLGHVDFEADVVKITVAGGSHGRVSWDGGNDELVSAIGREYCARGGGCECPPGTTGTPPQTPIPSDGAIVSTVGMTDATTLALGGASLDDYCHPDEPAPASGVDPCVVGSWESNEWTLPGAVDDGVGGAGARVRVAGNGRTEWDFDDMDPVVAHDEAIDVDTELYTSGSATGQIAAANGTWTVTENDTGGLKARLVDRIMGEGRLQGGPGLFVLLADGKYTCNGATLTYSSVDPVEKEEVTVVMHKR